MNKKKKKLYYIFLPFVAILLAVGIAVDILYEDYSHIVTNALGQQVTADAEYISDALENSKQVNIKLQEEGSVLLKNDGVLPLSVDDNAKINVYGILSAHHYTAGTGSGSSGSTGVDMKTALESVGFSVNADLWNFLASKELKAPTGSGVGQSVAGQYELSVSEYEAAVSFSTAKAYSEYAIVTFGSNGGEGSDGDRSETSNSLQLGANEIALLQKLDSEGFKIIALINGSYLMEPAPIIQYADAILWIGGTGLYGPYGVANLIAGNVSPSGRLVDTWPYEMKTTSSYYTSDSANAAYVSGSTKLGVYTNYNEGIYVGYRWYETADAEGFWESSYAKTTYGISGGYDEVVAYPFGYGLSYTTFSEEITDVQQDSEGNFVFKVKVKNTGTQYSAKHVAEIYLEKPYTNGGLEVSKVELVAFDKSPELEPGEEDTLTLTVYSDSLTSYDSTLSNGVGGYVRLSGEYKFYLASNTTGAHCWKTTDTSSSTHYYSVNLAGINYTGDNKRSSDYVVAQNLLETTDNDTKIKSNDATAGYNQLSRANGFANASQTISKEANTNGSVEVDSSNPLYTALKNNYGANTYSNYNTEHLKDIAEVESTALEQEKTVTIDDLWETDADGEPLYGYDSWGNKVVYKEVDYDDPRWETLLSQLSASEIEELIARGGYGTIALDSIDKVTAFDYDGPTGYTNFLKATLGIEQDTTGFCSEPIMAATWNVDLVEDYGKAVAIEGNAFGNTGWYAPGMNMHRTPFEGRTGEYYSEDPFITGMMGASCAYGAFTKGIYTYAKHFAFNEIEANRDSGMNCVMNEQTAREIYLKPFEIAIKQGKLTGLMSSFMYMNGQWNGGNFNLMYGIVRSEWNFKGVINTDLAGSSLMGAGRAICAGTDMLLGTSYNAKSKSYAWVRLDNIKTTDDGIKAMKTSAKHILYAYASAALHRDVKALGSDTSLVKGLYITANVVGYGGAAILFVLFAFFLVKDILRMKAAKECRVVELEDDQTTGTDKNE